MDRKDYVTTVYEHKDRLHTYAVWLLHDADEATEVTQEALVRLWTNRDDVRVVSARAWLLRTVYRLCIDHIRKRSRERRCDPEVLNSLMGDEGVQCDDETLGNNVRASIGQALSRLSQRDRMMILMREIQGMAYEEISQVLDLPMGTLKAALHRSRGRLRRELTNVGLRR